MHHSRNNPIYALPLVALLLYTCGCNSAAIKHDAELVVKYKIARNGSFHDVEWTDIKDSNIINPLANDISLGFFLRINSIIPVKTKLISGVSIYVIDNGNINAVSEGIFLGQTGIAITSNPGDHLLNDEVYHCALKHTHSIRFFSYGVDVFNSTSDKYVCLEKDINIIINTK